MTQICNLDKNGGTCEEHIDEEAEA